MFVLPVQNCNCNLNFQAANRVKINPKISEEVRNLADRADTLYNSVVNKMPVINGVSISTVNLDGMERVPKYGDVVTLKSNIDDQMTTLEIFKGDSGRYGESTVLHLILDGRKSQGIYYESNDNGRESIFTYDDQSSSGEIKALNTYQKRNAKFAKLVEKLLTSAEKFQELFNG